MARRGALEKTGLLAIAGVAACCGLVSLLGAGVAAVVLWMAGLGLLGAAVAVGGLVWFLRRARARGGPTLSGSCDVEPMVGEGDRNEEGRYGR